MPTHRPVAAVAAACVVAAGAAVQHTLSQPRSSATPVLARELRPASSFAGIADPRARSISLFEEAGKVLQHPRCVNCHPASDRPLQTDRMRPHQPLVVRGADGHGAAGMACNTCHGNANYDPARVPGDPHWHLAPASMALEGRSIGQICEQIKDPSRNGNRDIPTILRHVAEDSLILWAWSPGAGRTPTPGRHAEFGALLQAWADAGAHCPVP
jgi:hypothetical protein